MHDALHGTAIVESLSVEADWDALILAMSRLRDPVLLNSSLNVTPFSRYSILAADPVIFVDLPPAASQPFDWLRTQFGRYALRMAESEDLPFLGGWIGFLTYELGALIERNLHPRPKGLDLPLARFGLYDAAAVFDHEQCQWYGVAIEWAGDHLRERGPARDRLRSMERFLRASADATEGHAEAPISTSGRGTLGRGGFLQGVEEIKRYIRAGDVYQVNLAERWDAQTDSAPEKVYARLRRLSPSSHAAFLRWGDTAVISSSPELFLHFNDGLATTRPIKGTRPRTGHPALDGSQRRALEKSAKDRAELTMIVDLLRNDLGRVCEFGTVQVDDEGSIEAHPTLFHRVATIHGRLRSEYDWADLLTATFPCGSVTGAPKIRAMQIIEELEPTPRGAYCGGLGYIGLDGSMQFNVAIRTIVQRGDSVRLYAGSGVVADSVPELEYDEALAKARAMLLALHTDVVDGSKTHRVRRAAIA